jgi:F-type H+-transporting ATPase subunit delta
VHLSLRGYTTALLGDIAQETVGGRIADDLTAVAHLVSRTNDLSLVLTDFAVPRQARRAVLEDLLASRVHPTALRLVLEAVDTERADELPTSLHELYELALHLQELGVAQVMVEEPISTRGGWRAFASGYATAVFQDVEVAELEQVEDELFQFARVVESNEALRSALSDVSRSAEDRGRLLSDLLDGKVMAATSRVALLPLEGRVRDYPSALNWLADEAARARGWRVATVHTARAIDAQTREELTGEVRRITGHPVELHLLEEPDLLGGAVVELGDLLVDASASHRLDTLAEYLLGHEEAMTGAQN